MHVFVYTYKHHGADDRSPPRVFASLQTAMLAAELDASKPTNDDLLRRRVMPRVKLRFDPNLMAGSWTVVYDEVEYTIVSCEVEGRFGGGIRGTAK